jgi:hypothetical protein
MDNKLSQRKQSCSNFLFVDNRFPTFHLYYLWYHSEGPQAESNALQQAEWQVLLQILPSMHFELNLQLLQGQPWQQEMPPTKQASS